jgi:hypothetical protein
MKKNIAHRFGTLAIGAAALVCSHVLAQADNTLAAAAEAAKPQFLKGLARLVDLDSGSQDGAGLDKVADVFIARSRGLNGYKNAPVLGSWTCSDVAKSN